MRFLFVAIFVCLSGLSANAQIRQPAPGAPVITVPLPMPPVMSPPPMMPTPPMPSAIPPRPANELAPPPEHPSTVSPGDVDRMMQTICPAGESCASTPPAR